MRVLIADDNVLVRRGLVGLLEAQAGLEILAECSDLPQLERATELHSPDVVVTDIRMPPSRTDEGVRFAADATVEQATLGPPHHVDAASRRRRQGSGVEALA